MKCFGHVLIKRIDFVPQLLSLMIWEVLLEECRLKLIPSPKGIHLVAVQPLLGVILQRKGDKPKMDGVCAKLLLLEHSTDLLKFPEKDIGVTFPSEVREHENKLRLNLKVISICLWQYDARR